MSTTNDKEIIKSLVQFIKGGQAFAKIEDCLADIPANLRGAKPGETPHSLWQLVDHMRLAQWDILDFSRNPDYKGLSWPKDYWPKNSAPKDDKEWDDCIKQFYADRDAFIKLLEAPDCDLHTPFAWGKGQNLLREAMLIANHNSHHAGQVIFLRKILGAWK